MNKDQVLEITTPMYVPHLMARVRSLSAWRDIGDDRIYCRSKWEANYARYLEWLRVNRNIREWLHEPETFWFPSIKRGVRSYLPDFAVIENDGSCYYVEVKGYMDAKSATKIKRFRKYYPAYKLEVVDSKWFKSNNKKLKGIVPGWE